MRSQRVVHLDAGGVEVPRSEEHTSELQSQSNIVCRLLLEKKNVTSQHSYVAETYGVPSSSTGFPSQLAVGADGRFWFTLQDTTKPDTYIGAMTPGGQFSFF